MKNDSFLTKFFRKRMLALWLVLLFSLPSFSEESGLHWSVNIPEYKYDMSLFVVVSVNAHPLVISSNYEVGAFCGDECRGTLRFINSNGLLYGYLRVYSNQKSNEKITIRLYDYFNQVEYSLKDVAVEFSSDSYQGSPEKPLQWSYSKLFGDINADSKVNLDDLEKLRLALLKKERYSSVDCDINNDGKVTISDVSELIKYLKTKNIFIIK